MYYYECSPEIQQSIEEGKLVVTGVKFTKANNYYPDNVLLDLTNLNNMKVAQVVAYQPEITGNEEFELLGSTVKELSIWKTIKRSIYVPEIVVLKEVVLNREDEEILIEGENYVKEPKPSKDMQEKQEKSQEDEKSSEKGEETNEN